MTMPSHISPTPYDFLLTIEQEIHIGTRTLPYDAIKKDDWIGVSFISGDLALLTAINEIVEILPVSQLALVPGVKFWLRGMATCRGELFPVTDLSGFLTRKNSVITKDSRILLMKFQGELSGLLVDKVLGLQRIGKENRKKDKMVEINEEYAPFIVGTCIIARVEVPIISCQEIVHHPLFRDVALREDEMSEIKE